MTLRHVARWETIDGGSVYTFSKHLYEWAPSQPLKNANSAVPGASYGVSHIGSGPAAKGISIERIRTLAVESTSALLEAEIDEARAACVEYGEGKLWIVNDDASERWCYARAAGVADMTVGVGQSRHAPLLFSFERTSDWQDDTETEHIESAITTQTYDFVVNNPGNARCYWVLIEFAFWFQNPKITNLTNGYSIQVSRNATVGGNSYVGIDSELGTVKYSEDGGATKYDAYDLATLSDTQVGLFALDAGNNSLRVEFDSPPPTGQTPFVSIYFDAPFH